VRSSDVEDLGEGSESDGALFGRAGSSEVAAGADDSTDESMDCALGEIHMACDSWYGPFGLVSEINDSLISFGE